ncbi:MULTISPECIES: NADH-quinone oxidoreductase subunit L [unclassified Dysgonomonas]|uniref:NADH-quinone oxidoreductase subunit L n=1 Tax=unclassified Dysgonomonas TaxID=2630389 RepID=UPI0006812E5E|nr:MULTISPECIES: NADH-quinone oxidoreductase subunit L [unclassified Dysgonomonas]MBD8348874.1 NADH-quinone oxidoreductase subunit L [Dysgonomonas sp. HGC4]MBF0576345.1 NADH-quinone oxidoreductase subunit L [Dysgonomonas sp. GY617]
MSYTLLIIVLPAIMFLILGLLGGKMKPIIAGTLGTLSLAVMTALSYFTAYEYFFRIGKGASGAYETLMAVEPYQWLKFTDKLHIDLGIMLDPISVMMLVVITTVSLMVHIYSLGYMKGERGFQRYYAFLSLFSFSMLGLVVATNIFQMYIFWELVGVSSYSLISFYYTKPSAVAASKKAFIVTRFADLFFLIGILVLSYYSGTFDFQTLTALDAPYLSSVMGASFLGISALTWAMLFIFMGGAGKSAMMPFHIWLPDAMEGPTPASALIHAATMVVAGVFLVARLFPIYLFGTPEVLTIIGYVGGITSVYAAIVACTQTDIKRVLAFSTISQIAYMITALGVSGYSGHDGLGYMASMFHLFTHAFFKALLFLGAGAIIHAVHSNEMDDMGGLKKFLPITHITFLIACLAIAGIPPFSGFFSKDEILAAALHHDKFLFACLFLGAGLTAFYMFRLYYRIFWNDTKKHYHHAPHEAGATMTIPLIILAVFSVFSGFVPFADFISADRMPFEAHIDMVVAGSSVAVALLGIGIATMMYFKKTDMPDKVSNGVGSFYKWAYHKFYFDELWLFVTRKIIFNCISKPIAWFDHTIVDGFMNALAFVTNSASDKIKGLQSGRIQQYAGVYLSGALLIVVVFAFCLICFICK